MPETFESGITEGKKVTIPTTSELGYMTRKPGERARLICDTCDGYVWHIQSPRPADTWKCTECETTRLWGA